MRASRRRELVMAKKSWPRGVLKKSTMPNMAMMGCMRDLILFSLSLDGGRKAMESVVLVVVEEIGDSGLPFC